jgi:hypothetical protein
MRHSRQHVTETTPSALRKPTSQRGDPSVAQAAAAEAVIIEAVNQFEICQFRLSFIADGYIIGSN